MALNRKREKATQLSLPVPEGTESGDPLLVGDLPCVALVDRNDDGESTCQTDGSFVLSVDADAAAIEIGDELFTDGAGAVTNDDDSGANGHFGYALGAVDNTESDSIEVKIGH